MMFLRYSQTVIEANCYIVTDEKRGVALVVDPGAGSAPWVRATLEKNGLSLGGVLCTHGHADHVWDCAEVAGSAPVFVPEPDLYRMDDPASFTAAFAPAFVAASGHDWRKPENLCALPTALLEGGGAQIVPGITLRGLPSPGHTEGSMIFLVAGSIDEDAETPARPAAIEGSFLLSGDVIFKDGVGRTDLPGGSSEAAAVSLRTLTQVIDPATVFFPGHGPASTIGREMSESLALRQALIG